MLCPSSALRGGDYERWAHVLRRKCTETCAIVPNYPVAFEGLFACEQWLFNLLGVFCRDFERCGFSASRG